MRSPRRSATIPTTAPGQVRYIDLYREVVGGAKAVQWPAGGYQAVEQNLSRAYDAVAFEQLTAEEAADEFLAGLQEQVTNAAQLAPPIRLRRRG